MVTQGATGIMPIGWDTLRAFDELNQLHIKPFEAACLVEMSRAYVTASLDTNPLSIAPIERENHG